MASNSIVNISPTSKAVAYASLAVIAVAVGMIVGSYAQQPALIALLTLAGTAICAFTVVVAVTGARGLATTFIFMAVAAYPMSAIRATSALSVADIFLFASFLLQLPHMNTLLHKVPPAFRLYLTGLLFIFVAGIASSYVSGNTVLSIVGLAKLLLALFVPCVTLMAWRPTKRQVMWATWIFVISVSVSSCVGLLQTDSNADFAGRGVGLTQHPNALGLTAVLAIAPATACLFLSKGVMRIAALICGALIVTGAVVSGSRAAILGMAIALLTMLLWTRRFDLLGGMLAAGAIVYAALAIPLVQLPEGNAIARLTSSTDSQEIRVDESNSDRLQRLDEAVQVVLDHPILGVGFENATYAHNVYLQIATAGGLFALIGFGVLSVSVLLQAFTWKRTSAEDYSAYILMTALGSSFVGYLAAGMVHNALWERYIWILPALVFGRAYSLFLESQLSNHRSSTAP